MQTIYFLINKALFCGIRASLVVGCLSTNTFKRKY